jgi:carboxymethylenebutenolidase
MSEHVTLTTADGQDLDAYVARPEGEPLAGLVVVQEIFGVNRHIRSVADGYAKDGFLAVAPALFDRIERGVELEYEGADMQRAVSFIPKLDIEKSLADVAAAVEFAVNATGKKVGVIGYCYGGTLGKQDAHIPAEEVDKIQTAHPEVEIYWYDAGHGFNCDVRGSYNPEAARVARDRSLKFLKEHLA